MNNNLKEGTDYYFNESGLMVFTKEFHLKRGFCCGNGCMNCPYNYKNIVDQKKRELLQNNSDQKKAE